MGCATLLCGRFSDVQELRFKPEKHSDISCAELQGVYLRTVRNGILRLRNVEIWAVLSSNEVDLLILRNRVFRMLNFEKCELPSRKEVDFLMLRNRVFSLRNVQLWALPS